MEKRDKEYLSHHIDQLRMLEMQKQDSDVKEHLAISGRGCMDYQVKLEKEKPQCLNLIKILEGCPEGVKLYSPAYGELTFDCIRENRMVNPCRYAIRCYDAALLYEDKTLHLRIFNKDGSICGSNTGECMLFPSKEQRDWSKFEKPKQVEVIYPERVYWFEYHEQYGELLYDKLFELLPDWKENQGVQEGWIVYNEGKCIKAVDADADIVAMIKLFGVELRVKED